ncbi:MAG TPA: ADOP family duplicated permease [Bryobacterales bacterium]|nr:ADOP family duplicated permease [Bryobacterales bacterium]
MLRDTLSDLFYRLRALFRRKSVEKDLDEELQFHFEHEVEKNLRRGMSRAEARRQARLAFGAADQVKEECRDARGISWVEIARDDLKAAWTSLRHSPGFTAAAVVTLALAIGANTAIFSVADAVLFRPLPYFQPERVHILQSLNRRTGTHYGMTPYEYLQIIGEHHRGLGPIGIIKSGATIVASSNDGAEGIRTAAVSANYFQVLGIRPAQGRIFDDRDAEQPGRGVMLSHETWERRFHADEQIAGQSITLGTSTFDVVGVLPQGFVFPSWLVDRPEIVTVMQPVPPGSRDGTVDSVVRLEPGVTRQEAQAEIETLLAPVAARRSEPDASLVLNDVRSVLYPMGQSVMKFLLAAAGLVLLIGCVNLANMLLVRTERRERETGVRAALGASRARLVRPLILESAITGLVGAALAVLITAITFDALIQQVPRVAYRAAPVGVDFRVLMFALGLGLLSGLAFSAVPAWRAARMDVQALIQQRYPRGGGRRKGLGRPLVTAQVALAVVIVFGGVIVGRELMRVLSVPLGFEPANVLTVRVFPPGLEGLDRQAFYMRAAEALARRADVISVGATGALPLSGAFGNEAGRTPESRELEMATGIVHILPGYFETLGIRLLRGRLPDWTDARNNSGAAVVSESAARSLFGDREPIGAVFENGNGRRFTVIGVVTDIGNLKAEERSLPFSYVIPATATGSMTLVARVRARQDAMLADIRREIGALAPNTVVTTGWWADSIDAVTEFRNPRFQTLVLGSFGALGLGLTALGIFGVVAFLVASRSHEMGIRLAVGASPKSLVRSMVRQALAPVAAGLALGLAATQWLRPLAEAQFYKVEAGDPVSLALAALTVMAAALVAAFLAARRAGNVDPMIVLRKE